MNIKKKTNKQLRRMCVSHWKRIKQLSSSQISANQDCPTDNNCSFCNAYIHNNCTGCPIFEKTGKIHCHGTPYKKASDLYFKMSHNEWNSSKLPTLRKLVQKEIDFLENLTC